MPHDNEQTAPRFSILCCIRSPYGHRELACRWSLVPEECLTPKLVLFYSQILRGSVIHCQRLSGPAPGAQGWLGGASSPMEYPLCITVVSVSIGIFREESHASMLHLWIIRRGAICTRYPVSVSYPLRIRKYRTSDLTWILVEYQGSSGCISDTPPY